MIAIYARVSTEEQAKNGYSLQDQLRECKKKADSAEDIGEYIDDAVSGEFLDRPALNRLRKDLRDHLITLVICLDPDRLSRKLINQLILSEEIEKNAKLIFVNGEYENTPEGILFYQMRGAISEFEKAKINERMSRGRREKARQGRVVRDYRIYGYDYDTEKEQLVMNTYESEIVKIMFELFTKKEKGIQGINGIAKFLTDRGVPTKGKAPVWHRQVVRQILCNTAYIGQFYQNKWNTEGMLGNKHKAPEERVSIKQRPKKDWILIPCPAIIEKDVYYYAQKLLEESRRRWSGRSKNQYLLSGLVRCGLCGNTMTGVNAKNWNAKVFMYTDIKATQGAKSRGCGLRVKTAELDEKVWHVVMKWLTNEEDADELDEEPENTFEEAEMEMIDKRISEIQKSRKNLINFMAHSQEPDEKVIDDIRSSLIRLKDEEEKLTKRREDLLPQIDEKDKASIKRNLLKEAKEHYLSIARDEITFEDKKALIRYLVREVQVYKDEIKVFGF